MYNEIEIIDFHIHPFFDEKRNVCFYDNTVNTYLDIENDLKRAGIDYACGSVIERCEVEAFKTIENLNNEALKLRDLYNGFYIPGIHIHPKFVDESINELRRMNNMGVKLVGELVPYFMGWENYYDNSLHDIYTEIDRLGMVVSIHTQKEETIDKALENFPNIIFVGAHPGDKDTFFRHIDRMRKFENYYLDLSGTGIFRYGLISKGVEMVGSERFLFGTDYPICNPSMYVNAVLFEKLKDRDYENIFSENAKKILAL